MDIKLFNSIYNVDSLALVMKLVMPTTF